METVGFQDRSIMLWGGIFYEARTDLVILERGAINALRYLEGVLESRVISFAPFIEKIFFLCKIMPVHTSRELLLSTWIQSELEDYHGHRAVQTLNPIQHIWDNLKRRIRSLIFPPTTIPQLKDAALEEWNNIPQGYIKNIIDSIPNRLQEVIKA